MCLIPQKGHQGCTPLMMVFFNGRHEKVFVSKVLVAATILLSSNIAVCYPTSKSLYLPRFVFVLMLPIYFIIFNSPSADNNRVMGASTHNWERYTSLPDILLTYSQKHPAAFPSTYPVPPFLKPLFIHLVNVIDFIQGIFNKCFELFRVECIQFRW